MRNGKENNTIWMLILAMIIVSVLTTVGLFVMAYMTTPYYEPPEVPEPFKKVIDQYDEITRKTKGELIQ